MRRPEKHRNADRPVFTMSASDKYRTIVQPDPSCRKGHGRRIVHQNSTLEKKKQACSKLCQFSELRANSYAEGRCQPRYAAFIAIHATGGRVRNMATCC